MLGRYSLQVNRYGKIQTTMLNIFVFEKIASFIVIKDNSENLRKIII